MTDENGIDVPQGYHVVTRGKRKGQLAKDRSDKGKPKKQPETPAGMLSDGQVDRLKMLIADCLEATEELADAQDKMTAADRELESYLNGLRSAGKEQ